MLLLPAELFKFLLFKQTHPYSDLEPGSSVLARRPEAAQREYFGNTELWLTKTEKFRTVLKILIAVTNHSKDRSVVRAELLQNERSKRSKGKWDETFLPSFAYFLIFDFGNILVMSNIRDTPQIKLLIICARFCHCSESE